MKVLITPRSFGKSDPEVFNMLENSGITVKKNETGSILSEAQLKDAIVDCTGVIIGVDPLNADVLASAPNLRAVAKYGVGTDNIDMEYCERHGIKVSRTIGANSAAVADYTFALMLALARSVIPIDSQCRRGDWRKIATSDVSGKTLGLIGLGAIARHVARRAAGFDMKILAFDVFWDESYASANNIIKADVDIICRECDFISLHVPLLPETQNIIGAKQIAQMKRSAYIINTARGGLIDEDALFSALKDHRIAGAGLDAFAEEPPANTEWFGLDNVVLGSHCAASTEGAANAMGRMAVQNIIADLTAT